MASIRILNAHLFGTAGLVAVALGLLCTVQGLARGLRAERYVSLRRDGLIVRLQGRAPVLIEWNELDEVRHQAAQRAVLLILRDGSELLLTDRYTDTEADKLATLIATVRRRALWGYYDRR